MVLGAGVMGCIGGKKVGGEELCVLLRIGYDRKDFQMKSCISLNSFPETRFSSSHSSPA